MRKILLTLFLCKYLNKRSCSGRFLPAILFTIFIAASFFGPVFGQGLMVSNSGTGDFVVPGGVTAITVTVHGGGGGGGGNKIMHHGAGGGGGGGIARVVDLPVTPEQSFSYTVGSGGNGGRNGLQGTQGKNTSFGNGDLLIATGGQGGKGRANSGAFLVYGGVSGDGAGSSLPAPTVFEGGYGANGLIPYDMGGGGGSSAGIDSHGNHGVAGEFLGTSFGGSAPVGGGSGGSGGNLTNDGSGFAGQTPGGGGGGAGLNTYGTTIGSTGGAGGNGQVKIEWTCPASAGTLSGTQSVCTGSSTSFSSDVLGGSWTSSDTDVATVNSATGEVTGVSAGSAVITYTITGTGGCTNVTATRNVTVTQLPTAVLSGGGAVCEGSTAPDISIALTGTGPWSVTYNDVNGEQRVNVTESPYVIPGPYVGVYTATSVSNAQCSGTASGSATLLVIPLPVVGPINSFDATVGVSTEEIAFEGSLQGTVFDWSSDNSEIGLPPNGVGVTTFPAFVPLAEGTAVITVTPRAFDCTGTSETFTITVSSLPVIAPIGSSGTVQVEEGSNDLLTTSGIAGRITSEEIFENENAAVNISVSSVAGARTYTITPEAGTDFSASLVLYFMQDDFDAFNENSDVDLPTDPSDEAGITNLRILNIGSTTTTLNPLNVTWNAARGWWEVPVNVTHFSTFQLAAIQTGLPVVLSDFSVERNESAAELKWSTASEINSRNFEIQHSREGKVWKTIGSVAAKTESTSLTHYTFLHANPASGNHLYRLKMIDQDGTFAFSRIAALHFERNGIRIYPNPVSDFLTIDLDKAQDIRQVRLLDQLGRAVYISSDLSRSINVKNVIPGIYILEFTALDGKISTSRIVVNR